MVPAPKKKASSTDKSANKVPWKSNSTHGCLLKKMILGNKISKGTMAKNIIEDYPDFRKYKAESIHGFLHHIRDDAGINVCKPAASKFLSP